ncbi:hypothetical protein P8A22_37130 [Streptomyces laculatispora]|uniref:Uncharacterized protein n=1 Tax=Streptomyces laculatispora TaxID=887464 RepID=A0ABY9IED0_9ACTN|nr:hypothetical protein [Streptomyces laculatispora]WLQ45024.1 hypothetical protein P8A22_37130 [Streptomyces laculatispora]
MKRSRSVHGSRTSTSSSAPVTFPARTSQAPISSEASSGTAIS